MTTDITARSTTVAKRDRRGDIEELRWDKQTLDARYNQDCQELSNLQKEAERIRLLVVKQEAQVDETRARLQSRIRALADLELEESAS